MLLILLSTLAPFEQQPEPPPRQAPREQPPLPLQPPREDPEQYAFCAAAAAATVASHFIFRNASHTPLLLVLILFLLFVLIAILLPVLIGSGNGGTLAKTVTWMMLPCAAPAPRRL